MTVLTLTEAAMAAAQAATEAAAELIRYAREGDHDAYGPFAIEIVPLLADALAMAIGIDTPPDPDPAAIGRLSALETALRHYLEGRDGRI